MLRMLLMIAVVLEYSGMRATRTAADMEAALATAANMFHRHGIDRTSYTTEHWRGRVRMTHARAMLRFIEETPSD